MADTDPQDGQEPGGLDERVGKIEAEQDRQGGILDQILARLPGTEKAPGHPPQGITTEEPSGKTIAELVRDGVAELEAKKAKDERRAARDQQAADHADRIKALEERQPAEAAATPAGRVRSWTQRRVFGIDDPHK